MGKDTRAGRNSSHHIQLALFPRYIACMDCRGHHLFQGTLQVPLPYSLFSRGIGNHSVHTEFSGLLKSDDMEHARNLSLQHKGAVRERAALFVSVTAGNDTERKGNGRKTQTLANRELQGKVGKRFLSDGKVRPQAVSEKIILAALRYFSEKYDDPTARPTTSFESGNPMRKGCANKNKDDYILYYQAFETSDPTRLFAACAMHENKKAGF